MTLHPLGPRYVADRFPLLLRELVSLLRGLSPNDWRKPTVAGSWTVHDVAAHLLDGDLRKIAVYRDRHELSPPHPIADDRDLVRFINGVNAGGVAFGARLSSRVLVDLLEITGGWVNDLVASLPPHAPSHYAVSWAGEAVSENWMDTGREFTERWHHQAQIRAAVGAAGLLGSEWMEPVLDFSVRALPVAYAAYDARESAAMVLEIGADAALTWSLVREAGRWVVYRGAHAAPDTVVRMSADQAWRLFYNAFDAEAARDALRIEGDATLIVPMISVRSVIV